MRLRLRRMAKRSDPDRRIELSNAVRRGIEVVYSDLDVKALSVTHEPAHLIPASTIRRVLLCAASGSADPRGLRIRAARITGALDLKHVHPAVGVALIDCAFDQVVELQDAYLPWLTLTGSRVPGLVADRLQTDGELKLDNGFSVEGNNERGIVRLVAAHIRGQLDLSGAHLSNKSGPALVADRIQIDGTMCLKNMFQATGAGEDGTLRLPESHIASQLIMSGSGLRNESGPAFVGEQLVVDGAVSMAEPFIAAGHGDAEPSA